MEDIEEIEHSPLLNDLLNALKRKPLLVELTPQAVVDLFIPIIQSHSDQITAMGGVGYIQACVQESIEQWNAQSSVRGDINKTRFLAAMWVLMVRSELNELGEIDTWESPETDEEMRRLNLN